MAIPEYLIPGDKIAIISPATEIKPEYIDGASEWLSRRGYTPVVMPHARGPLCGTFAAGDAERTADFLAALKDPEIRMIFCSRGGYGCVHLLDSVDPLTVRLNPKWLLGFSDVSALHALWQTAGVASIHSSMAKQLALFPEDYVSALPFEIAEGKTATGTALLEISTDPHPGNIHGEACGLICGGNLAVINGLAATPYDIFSPEFARGRILFFEDVGEKIYQVERMLTRLHLAGTLNIAAGLVFGQFTDYRSDRNFDSMEAMIVRRLGEWGVGCPVALGFPVGHIDMNFPIVEGARGVLKVGEEATTLTMSL